MVWDLGLIYYSPYLFFGVSIFLVYFMRIYSPLGIVLLLALTALLAACQKPNNPASSQTTDQSTSSPPTLSNLADSQLSYHKITGQTMGTSYHISFAAPQNADITALQQQIDSRLVAINKSMSTYDDTATIMAFNRAKAGERIVIDEDFAQVLRDSYGIYQASDGAFDPTVQPLVLLWGFGKNLSVERLQAPPSSDEINAARLLIGLDKVHQENNAIYKDLDGVGLDFSAIAKGYGVDVIANTLAQQGISNYMVEIGGEIATAGVNDKGKAWQIAIDKPIMDSTASNREILTTLALYNDHMATSGNYRNHLQWQGVNYSHTINPHTAHPVADGVPSVTVLHDSTALADGWATALTAVPQTDAIALAERANIRALFVLKNGDDWQLVHSPAMQAHLAKNNQP